MSHVWWKVLAMAFVVGLLASGPAAAQSDDVAATLEALKDRVAQQDRRIAELEAKTDEEKCAQIRREEIRQILKEMNAELSSRDGNDMRVFWKNGLNFESYNGDFKTHVGGRVFIDWGWINGSGIEKDNAAGIGTDLEDGIEVRTARLRIDGTMYKNIKYQIEYDLAPSRAAIKDTFIELTKLPDVGAVRVGHFFEPFSMGQLVSSSYTTFMEPAAPVSALAPARNMGVMAHNSLLGDAKARRMTWALGLFRDTDDYGAVQSDGGYNVTGRVTGLPWYADGGRKLLHVGLAYSLRTPNDDDRLRYRERPEAHFISQRFVDTGNMFADRYSLLGAELAMVLGSFHLESESITSIAQGETGYDDACFNGWYVQAGYFLTGEHRPYKHSEGVFDRVKPKKNFRENGGWGAWEIAARYSFLDLAGRELTTANSAGQLHDVTLGLNWYLNPNVRFMANYIRSCPDRIDTANAADIFMLRFQYDF